MPSTERKLTNFCKNLRYIARLHRLKQEELAAELGWNRAVLAKLMSGERDPNVQQAITLASFFRIDGATLELDHEAFRARFGGSTASSNLPLLTFRTLRENNGRWQTSFEKYRGQYVLYYMHNADTVIGSLLEIDRLTTDGLHVTLINPHRDSSGNISAYEYHGYFYPVREYMYFLLEQKTNDYEILSIVLHEARTPSVNVLKGMISGIGVVDEVSYIAARPLVALKRQRRIENWRDAIGKELGYGSPAGIPEAARRLLSNEKVTVLT
ncbi:helix-turn-helix domain-containing protein [Bradyrhizobium sp. USDA 4353]